LACNAAGTVVVSGSPDKYVRVWDPKIGSDRNQTHRLQGHSDTVRDLLLSEDGRWVLSASSDTTIKLWDLSMPNHCITTYSYSDAPIWSLHSSDPNLSTFWAGGRDGWIYKIHKKQISDEYFADCIALGKDEAPILKVILN
jgi:WD repeat-containing protein 48